MGSVLVSTICHYCGPDGERATTEDHIVPKKFLPRPLSQVPYWFRQHFVVSSCGPCNNVKGWYRSTCICDQCTWTWNVAAKLYLPLGIEIKIVDVAMLSRARRLGLEQERQRARRARAAISR